MLFGGPSTGLLRGHYELLQAISVPASAPSKILPAVPILASRSANQAGFRVAGAKT